MRRKKGFTLTGVLMTLAVTAVVYFVTIGVSVAAAHGLEKTMHLPIK